MKKFAVNCLNLSVLIVAALSFGCSSQDDQTLAVIGDKIITVEDYKEFTQAVPFNHATIDEELSERNRILDSMIVTELLILAAYEKGIDKNEEVARVILANRPQFLLDALYTDLIKDVDVSEAEKRDFWNKLEFKLRAFQVLVADADTAQMLFERLKAGADIEQVAFEYSIDQSAKRNRGDVGYFVWGAMVDEFQEAAFSMEPGELSPPVESSYGYHIIKVVAKEENENRGSYEEMEESINGQILNRKNYRVTMEFFDGIKEKYPMVVDPSPFEYILHKRDELYPPQLLEKMPRSDFDIEQLDRNERELVVATWEGGQVTIAEYLQMLVQQQVPIQFRPDLDDIDSIKTIIFELKKLDIVTYEAIKLGFENSPEFEKKIGRYKDLVMAASMRDDSIQMPPLPNDEEARAYYEANQAEFSNPAQVHVYEILLTDELQAKNLARTIKSLDAFRGAAMDLTERPGRRQSGGDLGYIEKQAYPGIFNRAWKTAVGGIGGPIFVDGRYSIIYVVDRKEAELKDYLGLKRNILTKLSNLKAIATFSEWVDERMSLTNIERYEDLLRSMIDESKYSNIDTTSSQNN